MIEIGVYPIPSSPAPRSVLIFGGTFDPPHRAHFDLPPAARDAIGADWLLYVPAGRSPHKNDGPVASGEDRVGMLRAGLEEHDRVSISTMEIERHVEPDKPSYTVTTLERLRTLAPPETRFRLLIGADQAAGFHRWREPRRIVELAEPVVMLREPHESSDALIEALRAHWTSAEVDQWRGRIVRTVTIDVSATRARELLARGAFDNHDLRAAIPPPVLDYIRAHGLYQSA